MDIRQVPGLKNKFLGGEGLFNTLLTGPRQGLAPGPCPSPASPPPCGPTSPPGTAEREAERLPLSREPLLFCKSCVKAREEPAQRQYHEPRGEVPGGVHGVEGEPRDYPGYSPLPAEAEGPAPARARRARRRPARAGRRRRGRLSSRPRGGISRGRSIVTPQSSVHMYRCGRPPDGEAPCEALEQGVDVDGIERLRAVYQGQQAS